MNKQKITKDLLKIRKLNLGCGFDKRVDYINIDLNDVHNPDICADISSLPFLRSGYYEEIIAQDVLEHLKRSDVIPALNEWGRLLRPNGVLILRIPSLLHLSKMLLSPKCLNQKKAEEIIHLIYGTQAYNGDFHLSGFTPVIINSYLSKCGLMIIYADIQDGWLLNIKAKKTSKLTSYEELIHNTYFKTLFRPVDIGGLKHYLQKLQKGFKINELKKDLMSSSEAMLLTNYPFNFYDYQNIIDTRALNVK